MNYKVYQGNTLKATVTSKTATITGLLPLTTYTFGVTPNNGLRDGTQKTITVKTRGVRLTIPTTLTAGAIISLRYQEYSLGLVPIGTEPVGMFGCGNQRTIPATVITSGTTSTVELTTADNSFADGTAMNKLEDGSFGAFNGIKAIYYG